MHPRIRLALILAVVLGAACGAPEAEAQRARDLNAVGVEHYNQFEFADAIEQFQAALQLEPNNETIRGNLSNAYQAYASACAQSGDYASAIVQLERAIQLNPTNPLPLIQIGAYYLHEDRVRDAVFRLEDAIELTPGDTDAHFLLGEAYYRDNDVPSALEQWEWVSAVDPDKDGLSERLESARRELHVEADFDGRTSRHFNITYSRTADARIIRDVLTILEKAYREVGAALGHTYPPTPIQVSLYTSEGFSESTRMNEHVGAIYDGSKIRCPIVDAQGTPLSPEELRRRLYHEYVHVVVRHLSKEGVPWWLNEGLAEALTHDVTDTERRYLRKARQNDALFSLADLTESQLGRLDVDTLYLAYKQAHVTVCFLKDRFGTRRFQQLLQELARGEDPETALRHTFRYTYRTLELAVGDYIQNG